MSNLQSQQVMSPYQDLTNSLTKLTDESKYLQWSYDLEQLLRQKALWHTIQFPNVEIAELYLAERQGALPIDADAERVSEYIEALRPAFRVSDEQKKAWRIDNGKASAYIAKTVGELFHPIVREPANSTARRLWFEIEARCRQVNQALWIRLENEYNDAKMSENEDPREFLDRVTAITIQLLALGIVIPEERIVHKILSQMISMFAPLQMTVRSLLQARARDQHTIAFLREQFTGVTNPNKSKKMYGAMNVESHKFKKNNQNRFKAGICCYYCGKEGHYESECKLKKKQKSFRKGSNQNEIRRNNYRENYNNGNQNQNVVQNQNANMAPNRNANQYQLRPQFKKPFSNNAEEAMMMTEEIMFVRNSRIVDPSQTVWILDSGCTKHMTANAKLLHNIRPLPETTTVKGAMDSENKEVKFEGDAYLDTTWRIKLMNVLLVPGMRRNLISARKLAKTGAKLVIEDDMTNVYIRGELALQFQLNDRSNLYELVQDPELHECHNVECINKDDEALYWHEALGHLSISGLKKLQDLGLINTDLKGNETIECVACEKGKATRKPFPNVQKEIKVTKIGELIHSDLCGPIQPASNSGKRYFVTYTDEYTRYTNTYFMVQKSEQINKFREYKAMLKTQHNAEIVKLRTDSGGEYTSNEFEEMLSQAGTEHQSKPPRTSAYRGISERLNRTLMDKARAMLKAKDLPKQLWAEAIHYATFLKNCSVTKLLPNTTPFERVFKEKAPYKRLGIFGSTVEFKDNEKKQKLDDRTTTGIYLGYDRVQHTARILVPATGNITYARSGEIFFHDHTYFKPDNSELKIEYEEARKDRNGIILIDDDDEESDTEQTKIQPQEEEPLRVEDEPVGAQPEQEIELEHIQQEPVLQRSSVRINKTLKAQKEAQRKQTDKDFQQHVKSKINRYHATNTETSQDEIQETIFEEEPTTYEQILNRQDKENWLQAMKNEIESLYENNVFHLVPENPDIKAVTSKWVFKLKRKPDGSVDKYKARLVARGFTQEQGINFQETFAPTLRIETIRYLLNYALDFDLEVHHMDVNCAFLNGDLKEEIYLKLPIGFAEQHEQPEKFRGQIAKLNKSLYGLKQAMRCWTEKIRSHLTANGVIPSNADSSVYILHSKGGNKIEAIIAVYVDDCLIIAKSEKIEDVKKILTKKFKMTDMGKLKGMLGINFNYQSTFFTMDQSYYLENLLHQFGMNQCRPVTTPVVGGEKFTTEESEKVDGTQYRRMIGALQYLAKCTRPDIAYAVNQAARKMQEPTHNDLIAVKRILRYLAGTRNYGLLYERRKSNLLGYADASYGEQNDRKSTSGYAFVKNGAALTWSSRKQPIVALSSMEAELIALNSAAKESLWLAKLKSDLGEVAGAILIYQDNQGTIRFAHDGTHNDRSKHIAIRYHFIREKLESGDIKIQYLPTTEMAADVLTKGLGAILYTKFRNMLGVVAIPQQQ